MNLYYAGNTTCWISDSWKFNNLQTIILENEFLRIVVVPDRGADIAEFRYKPFDIDFLLQRPQHNPQQTTPSAYTDHPFLDYFGGGWNTVLPNGGDAVSYKGAELGQHGDVSLLRWRYDILEDTPAKVSVRFSVQALRVPLKIEKTLTIESGQPILKIDETVTNEAGETLDIMWGQHIAFGEAFLAQGAYIDVPPCQLWVHEAMEGYEPRRFAPDTKAPWSIISAPDGSKDDASYVPAVAEAEAQEMAYLAELSDGWYAITDIKRHVGFGLRFDHKLFKYIWYWQQLSHIAKGYPWWGKLHTTALEPWTSFPTLGLPEAIKNGSAVTLNAGESISTSFQAIGYHNIERVQNITQDGAIIPA